MAHPPRPEALRTEEARCVVCASPEARPVGRGRDFEYASGPDEFDYVACAGCGHVYLRNRPVPEELPRIYPPEYGNYEAARSEALTFRVKAWLDARALRRLAADAGGARRILDVGCADGRLLDVCRAALPAAEVLHGVEISERAAEGARAKGYAVSIGTIDEVELAQSGYDLVFLQQVIEHVYAPDRVLEKLAGALAPGGLLVLDTPTPECLDYRLFHRRYWGGYHIPRHFNVFSERSLLTLCTKAGLAPVRTRYTPQPIHWAWSFRHLLAEKGAPRFTRAWLHLQNPVAMGLFTLVELAAGAATGRMSNLQLVVRRPRSSHSRTSLAT